MKKQSSFNIFLLAMAFILVAAMGTRAQALDFDQEIKNHEKVIDQVVASLKADRELDSTSTEALEPAALEEGDSLESSNQDGLQVVLISKK